ncbi:MAG: GNAT family N-acetyltransferase [Sphingomonadales bacterium]|nr:GNAT family N-acetyltransferase [Sphingomonadales bacterium]
MSDITIRPANEADVPLILRFIRELAIYEKLEHEVVATEDGLRTTLFGVKPAAEVLIASLRGEPVGFALFFSNFSTFLGQAGLYLEDLYVVPEARGKGAGLALLRELARIAIARGYGRLEWWVLDWNQPSIDFYKALGAEPMDDWTVYRLGGEAMQRLAAGS